MTTPTPLHPTDERHLHHNQPHVLLIEASQQDDQDEETRAVLCRSYAHAREVMAREKYALILATRWGGGMDREDETYRHLIEAGHKSDWKTVNAEWQFSEELGVTFSFQPLETATDMQAEQDELNASVARLVAAAEQTEHAGWDLIDVLHRTANRQAENLARASHETQIRSLLREGVTEDEIATHLPGATPWTAGQAT